MAMNYSEHFSLKSTPQTDPAPNKTQVKNNAGGFVFELDKWARLNRFLLLGSEGGTFYCSEKEMSVENAKNVIECIKENGPQVVAKIVEISYLGKAPKNDAAIFALALCATFGNLPTKQQSYIAISKVCRIATHIFQFCESIQKLRGWSRGLRGGVAQFYLARNADQNAYQVIKYQQRNGWTHKDVLRLAHPSADDAKVNEVFKYAVGKLEGDPTVAKLRAFEEIKNCKQISRVIELIHENDLPREVVPTEMLNNVQVWEALLENMPLTALIRNLGKMTSVGLLTSNLSNAVKMACTKILSKEGLKKARVHPINLLLAMKTYAQGRGMKGSLTWSPVAKVIESLEAAFYLSFSEVEPTRQNYLLGLDISGSTESAISGYPISVKEVEGVLAMVTARTEENHEFLAFDQGIKRLGITKTDSLPTVMKKMAGWSGGSTDCSLPMIYAMKQNIPVNVFAIYTDNETWAGQIHPFQALKAYREKTGIGAKLVVLGMTASQFTIADPNDAGMLDICGFSPDIPEVIRAFSVETLT